MLLHKAKHTRLASRILLKHVCMFEALNIHAQLTKRVCIKENATPVEETDQKH